MRRPGARGRVVRFVALAAATALTAGVTSGCASLTSRPNAARTGEVRAAATPGQTAEVWKAFVAARAADPRAGSAKTALTRVDRTFAATGRSLERTAVLLARAAKKRPLDTVTYGRPVFVVPRVFGYPKWFLVRVDATARAGAQVRWLVFARARAGQAWTQVYEVAVPAASAKGVPGVFLDTDGLAEEVPEDATDRLVLAPGAVPDAWARAVVAGKAAGPVAGEVFRARRTADRDADVLGLGEQVAVGYTAVPTPDAPVFALRTKGGGALVLCATDDVRSYTPAPGAPKGLTIAVTGDYALLARKTQLRTMTVRRQDQWLAAVPVGEGAVQVLGVRSGLVSVTGTS